MTSRSARSVLLVVGMLALGLASLRPSQAQARTEVKVEPIAWNVTLDPNDPLHPEYACLPERIHLSGELRSQITKITDAQGKVHYTHHMVPMGVVGYGETSGARYRATGTHYHSGERLHGGPVPPPPFHLAEMQNFHVIGQGTATDFMLKLLARVTVNANGAIHGEVVQFRVECR